ncbi:EamA family transporter [Xenorhabdus stockiae]|uniref:EamA family transporter n=1 Tax=Xenorhabdus stockiae TaxID=351614 RepID=UPI004064A97A
MKQCKHTNLIMLDFHSKILPNFYGLCSGVFWGLSCSLLALLLKDNTLASCFIIPIIIAFMNDFISFISLYLYLLCKKGNKKILSSLKNKNNLIIFVAAIFGGPMGMSFYVLSIKYIGVGYTVIISSLYPAIGALISFFILKDRIHKIGLLGLLLAVVCTVILGYSVSSQIISGKSIGFFFAFLCALGWGAGSEHTLIDIYPKNTCAR